MRRKKISHSPVHSPDCCTGWSWDVLELGPFGSPPRCELWLLSPCHRFPRHVSSQLGQQRSGWDVNWRPYGVLVS